jgi:hypothetical protein
VPEAQLRGLLNGPAEAEKGAGCFPAMRPGGIFNAGSNGTALDEKKGGTKDAWLEPISECQSAGRIFPPRPLFLSTRRSSGSGALTALPLRRDLLCRPAASTAQRDAQGGEQAWVEGARGRGAGQRRWPGGGWRGCGSGNSYRSRFREIHFCRIANRGILRHSLAALALPWRMRSRQQSPDNKQERTQ